MNTPTETQTQATTKRKVEPTLGERFALQQKVLSGELTMGESIRALRKQVGLTQPKFAKRFGVFSRVQLNIENDNANPTVATLNKILGPFGLCVGIVKKRK